MRLATAILAAFLLIAAGPIGADAARLGLGFDDGFTARGTPAWAEADELGVETVRIDARWNEIAPTAPRRARQPSDAAYRWDAVDAAVETAAGNGRAVLLSIGGTPQWARADRGRGGRPDDPAFLPRRAAWKSFVVAIATRYSGTVDPDGPGPRGVLPRIELFEIWPTPNRTSALRPQRRGSRLIGVALYKRIYRDAASMLATVGTRRGYAVTAISGGVAVAEGADDTDPSTFLASMGRARLRPDDVGLRLAPPGGAPSAAPAGFAPSAISAIAATVDRTWRTSQPGFWLIDYGVGSGPAAQGIDEAVQANAVQTLLAAALDPRVRYAEWRLLQDPSGADGTGLRAADGRPKAAWSTWLATRAG